MKSGLTLDNITNGLLTIQKLRQLNNNASERDKAEDTSYIYSDKLSLLQETLNSVASFLPQTRGASISEALRISNTYSTAYRGIKHQVRDIKRGNFDISQILSGLRLLSPLLQNNQRLYVDKVVRAVEALRL